MQRNAKDVNWLYRQPEMPEKPRLKARLYNNILYIEFGEQSCSVDMTPLMQAAAPAPAKRGRPPKIQSEK